jgi:chorismate-pyruvate lyase
MLSTGYAGLSAGEKLLLCSDGSLTLHLEALYGAKVEVEKVELEIGGNAASRLAPDVAAALDEEAGKAAVERNVWLSINGKRLVFAHSVIPEGSIEKWLKDSLDLGEPLGRALEKAAIPVFKTGLRIGVIRSEAIASGFGLAPDALLFARRYRLMRGKPGGWVIKAEVCEVYSPELARAL